MDTALALPRLLRVGSGLDHLVPEQEADGQWDLDLPLLDGPEIGKPLFDLRELEGLVLFASLVMGLGLVELPEYCEEGGPNGVPALVVRLRGRK
jgi:hypothetical protein